MTAAEWLTCIEPTPMFEFLRTIASERKMRHFACASCRRIWDLLIYPSSRNAVEVAERFAADLVSNEERAKAYADAAREAAGWMNGGGLADSTIGFATTAAAFAASKQETIEDETTAAGERVSDILIMAEAQNPDLWPAPLLVAAIDAARAAATSVLVWQQETEEGQALWDQEDRPDWATAALTAGENRAFALGIKVADFADNETTWDRVRSVEDEIQCDLLRDIFGNPFGDWRFESEWRTPTVVALAREIYDKRSFDQLAILADALQDAGCDNSDILNHCRDANHVHVRGCWVLDLVLGKE